MTCTASLAADACCIVAFSPFGKREQAGFAFVMHRHRQSRIHGDLIPSKVQAP